MASRLGSWQPLGVEQRLDRLESLAEIGQLVARYALAVDTRDLDALVGLFSPHVRIGRDKEGQEALKEWFGPVLSMMRVSVHFVGNHVIDFEDADHASGIVYCHDELERPATQTWDVGQLQYWDDYVRLDGQWFFDRRRFSRWYLTDVLSRPSHAAGLDKGSGLLTTKLLPDSYPSWHEYWTHYELPK
jgi:SnoaL-like domain